jgi:hypothetical protein
MAALTATTPTRAGTATAGSAVAASDTISAAQLGRNGDAAVDNVTISDSGSTPSGTPLAGGSYAATVTNGTSKIFKLTRQQVDPVTGLVTITHSVTATVTYKLYPLG